MTDSGGTGELTGWKGRLLDRIRDLASAQWRISRDNDLDPPWPQKPDPALDHLRARLRELSRQEHELAIRARASGIPRADVDLAANVFVWGHRRAPVLEGDAALRARLIDATAADIWTLEHMAAIAAELQWRHRRDPGVPDTQMEAHYAHRMAVIWNRTAAVTSAAGISDREQAELWGRDHLGWINLFHETTHFYSDRELEDRWRAHADPSAGIGVTDATDAIPIDLAQPVGPDVWQPSVQALIDRAAEALNAEIRAVGSDADYEDYRLDFYLGGVIPAAGPENRAGEAVAEPDRQRSPDDNSGSIKACGLANDPTADLHTNTSVPGLDLAASDDADLGP